MSGSESGDEECRSDIVRLLSQYGDSLLSDDDTTPLPVRTPLLTSGSKDQKHIKNKSVVIGEKIKNSNLPCVTRNRTPQNVKERVKEALSKSHVNRTGKRSQTEPGNEDLSCDEESSESDLYDGESSSSCECESVIPQTESTTSNKQPTTSCMQTSTTNIQLQKMKEKLGLLDFVAKETKSKKQDDNGTSAAHVCGADLRPVQKKRPPPEVVVFNDSRSKTKRQAPSADTSVVRARSHDGGDFDLKRARHDVRRFGITGLSDEHKEDATVALMVSLGAKAPQKAYENYAELQVKIKKQIEERGQKREWDRNLGYKVTSAAQRYTSDRAKKKRDRNDLGVVDGQIGLYRGGVQKLTKSDINSVKKSSKKRKR